ncbi:YihA family ribosome biogenesis GTP-binding protein [Paramagnetospirillum marisnigri]|uniref:Probable GTP-binding protein EngB n=1 Tax=Paramagnetospirillum marisnigri TaxID=1285242 RepID=A0A178MYU0_9PROT|nr:ribosome biogenesis GTP-binding protein YihA/YsxC [Paramagnetospirillum marisnigri]OAN55187.1 YihA family ribosome biogenesis GTP-binding protein [Paramagnetospirillum marisnigri]
MGDHAPGGGRVLSDTAALGPDDEKEKADLLEVGRLLFARECTFMRGAVALSGLPDATQPEVAFAGRSNVGKSSLINALTGRKGLARASNTPGRTQELNFFDLGGRLVLVDMPGYGFASAPKGMVEKWTRLVNGFLKGRPVLRRAIVLVDARHGLKDSDRDMMTMLDKAAVVYQLVLTKADKIKPAELDEVRDRTLAEIAKRVAAHPTLIATSSETGLGIAELRAELASLA